MSILAGLNGSCYRMKDILDNIIPNVNDIQQLNLYKLIELQKITKLLFC
jgi:hypothetical protein